MVFPPCLWPYMLLLNTNAKCHPVPLVKKHEPPNCNLRGLHPGLCIVAKGIFTVACTMMLLKTNASNHSSPILASTNGGIAAGGVSALGLAMLLLNTNARCQFPSLLKSISREVATDRISTRVCAMVFIETNASCQQPPYLASSSRGLMANCIYTVACTMELIQSKLPRFARPRKR